MGRWVTVISRTRIVQAKAGKPWARLMPLAFFVPVRRRGRLRRRGPATICSGNVDLLD
jgi:hypothetical protein